MDGHRPADRPGLARSYAGAALGALRKRGPYRDAVLPAHRQVLPAAGFEPRRLAAYAEVCGFAHTDPLPVTAPHVLGFPLALRLMAARDFPFPLPGLVHTDIEVVRHRALRAADRPEIRVHAEGLAPHRRGSRFDVVTTALLDGTEVWRSRSGYLCRHRTAPDAPDAPDTPEVPDATSAPDAAAPEPAAAAPAPPLPTAATWRLPADLGRRYAAASGDRNPIHLHPLTARVFGFPRAIAHGMWTFARCLADIPADDGPFTATARFLAPVRLPGTVTFGTAPDGPGHAFEVRDGADPARLHLSGRTVSSALPSSGSPGPSSRSS